VWFNRRTLAIGASGTELRLPWYVRFHNYSTDKEIEADLKGLAYWKKLGWDCRIWVHILEGFQHQGYTGDSFHPTERRLREARKVCEPEPDQERPERTESEVSNPKIPAIN
jgi:hypothetical protein